MHKHRLLLILVFVLTLPALSHAGWLDDAKEAGSQYLESQTTSSSSADFSSLTNSDAIKGLKAALRKAVNTSISSLGTTNGFMSNEDVKIPLPDSLGKVETALRVAGQEELADQFVTSMNRAAEQAVPLTKTALISAVKKMTIKDAMGILEGGDTAATEYFQRTMTADLTKKLEPVISEATDSVNVTKYYKEMTQAASLMGIESGTTDLDGYVTEKTLDGLFYVMGQEEKDIRENPLARTSAILQKVFGSN